MDESILEAVRERAGHACEYCRLPQDLHPGPFEVEHVLVAVSVLAINDPVRVALRQELIDEGRFPPA
jgi:hypothetical protein